MSDDYELNGHGAFADGELTATVSGREGEALVHKLCADEAVSLDKALSLLAWFEENCESSPKQRQATLYPGLALERIFKLLKDAGNPWLAIRAMMYALNQPALDDLLGHSTPAELARQADMTKYNVIKLLKHFQTELNLPPRAGQRSAAACANMARTRNARLRQH